MRPVKTFFTHRELLLNLINRNLKARYAGSALGIFWAFLHPLLLAMVVGFVFSRILRMDIEDPYLFIISGMLPWAFLSGSLQESVMSIPANVSILKQSSLPREFIPIAQVLANWVLFLLGLLVVIPIFLFVKGGMGLTSVAVLIIVALLQLFFVSGVSLVLSAGYVYFRDTNQLLNVFLLFWLWLTPVFYSISMIPLEYRGVFDLNPMTPYIHLYRSALLHGGNDCSGAVWTAAVMAVLSVFGGFWFFYRVEKDFLKRI